jgi:signal transduction histidine kinase
VIAVEDTGPGIAAKDRDVIFEVFRQAKSNVRKAEGTGLGLPISRRLAEAHGGRLWVESILGQGATFYVALPIKSSLVPIV